MAERNDSGNNTEETGYWISEQEFKIIVSLLHFLKGRLPVRLFIYIETDQ